MIVKTLKSNNLFVLIVIPLVAIALWIKTLLVPTLPQISSDFLHMPLFNPVYLGLEKLAMPRLTRTLALLLLIGQGFLLARLNFRHKLVDQKTYLPSIIFILFSASFIQLQRIHPIYFSNILLILALDSIFSAQKKEKAISNFLMPLYCFQ